MANHTLPDRVSGIYAIVHIASGRRYVGSAQNVNGRFRSHRYMLRKGIHHSVKLQRAWKKYGPEAFSWTIIETVPDLALMIGREQHWMDHHFAVRDGFNVHPNASGPRGHKMSAEIKAAFSAARKGRLKGPQSAEHRANLSAARMGSKWSMEDRAKMSARLMGKPRPEATRAKMRDVLTQRNKTPEMRAVSAKNGAASKGRKPTLEARAKMSAAGKGKPKTPEHLAAIRAAKSARSFVSDQQTLEL